MRQRIAEIFFRWLHVGVYDCFCGRTLVTSYGKRFTVHLIDGSPQCIDWNGNSLMIQRPEKVTQAHPARVWWRGKKPYDRLLDGGGY